MVVHCACGWLGLGSGAWHPLTPSWVPSVVEDVEVVQLVPTAGEQIVVCQCHRSCASTGAAPGQGC